MMKDSKKLIKIALEKEAIYLGLKDNFEINQVIPWSEVLNLNNIIEKETGIKKKFIQKVEVLIHDPSFLLIPKEFQEDLYTLSMMQIALGEEALKGKEIHQNECKNIHAYLNFAVPSNWKDLLALEFPLAEIIYHHPIAEYINQLSEKDSFQIHFFSHFMYVILQKNGKLELANHYAFQSSLELAFYIHSIIENFEMDTNDIQYTGIENLSDATINELQELALLRNQPIHE